MGRILKKKDPSKKKAQRQTSVELNAKASKGGTELAAAKPVSVVKKNIGSEKSKMGSQEPNFVQKSIQFLREVKIELKKVTWPTRKQTMGSTMVVLVLVVIISLFLGLVDISLSSLIQMVLP
jgi:preprotein translocase subunit SecE